MPRRKQPARPAAQRLRSFTHMDLRARVCELGLAREFAIARGSRNVQEVVQLELEHDGLVGTGEWPRCITAARRGSALAFLSEEAPVLVGEDPLALEAIGRRLERRAGEAAAKAALDAALHDWIGKRLGLPVWRLGPRARGTADVMHDRDRLARGHARARARRERLSLPEGQAGRSRRPRAAGRGARGVAGAAARTQTRAGRSNPRASCCPRSWSWASS